MEEEAEKPRRSLLRAGEHRLGSISDIILKKWIPWTYGPVAQSHDYQSPFCSDESSVPLQNEENFEYSWPQIVNPDVEIRYKDRQETLRPNADARIMHA